MISDPCLPALLFLIDHHGFLRHMIFFIRSSTRIAGIVQKNVYTILLGKRMTVNDECLLLFTIDAPGFEFFRFKNLNSVILHPNDSQNKFILSDRRVGRI